MAKLCKDCRWFDKIEDNSSPICICPKSKGKLTEIKSHYLVHGVRKFIEESSIFHCCDIHRNMSWIDCFFCMTFGDHFLWKKRQVV